jgi:hypothetical protein
MISLQIQREDMSMSDDFMKLRPSSYFTKEGVWMFEIHLLTPQPLTIREDSGELTFTE